MNSLSFSRHLRTTSSSKSCPLIRTINILSRYFSESNNFRGFDNPHDGSIPPAGERTPQRAPFPERRGTNFFSNNTNPFDNPNDGSIPPAGDRTPQRAPFPETTGTNLFTNNTNQNTYAPYPRNFQNTNSFIPPRDGGTGRSSLAMNFVRDVISEEGRGNRGNRMGGAPLYRENTLEQNADFVHIKLLRNNTFVTVTDNKGNVKLKASSGCLAGMKGGPKVADATAEHVGRLAKDMGLKSVVMKVNGFTFFKKKRSAIMSFKEGFTNSRDDQNPIVYIEDTTRLAHNGCRLPKKRRT